MDVYHLLKGNRELIQDAFVKRFESFDKYALYAKKVGDFDILGKCQIVQKYGGATLQLVERIR